MARKQWCYCEGFLAIAFEANEIADPGTKDDIENVFRAFVAHRAEKEEWSMSIRSMAGCHQVTVKGPSQTREKLFFDEISMLPEKIRVWLDLYPLS
jgi:hypothetical protein